MDQHNDITDHAKNAIFMLTLEKQALAADRDQLLRIAKEQQDRGDELQAKVDELQAKLDELADDAKAPALRPV